MIFLNIDSNHKNTHFHRYKKEVTQFFCIPIFPSQSHSIRVPFFVQQFEPLAPKKPSSRSPVPPLPWRPLTHPPSKNFVISPPATRFKLSLHQHLFCWQIKNKRLNFSRLFHHLWSIADSNRLPQHCQCCALPDELMPRFADAKVIPFLELTNFFADFFQKKILHHWICADLSQNAIFCASKCKIFAVLSADNSKLVVLLQKNW